MARNRKRWVTELTDKCLISYMNPQSTTAAQFRAIRNNLDNTLSANMRVLAVTSPGAREGKTMTAVNIAISRMQRGEKVLIIDANMQNPVIHDIFKAKISPGLTNVLSANTQLEEAIYETEFDNLEILPFGTLLFNSMEMIDSVKMNELLFKLKEQYDCVVVDTASVLDMIDTSSLASKCDGVILVVNHGKTLKDSARKAKRSLEVSAKANVVGVVLNRS